MKMVWHKAERGQFYVAVLQYFFGSFGADGETFGGVVVTRYAVYVPERDGGLEVEKVKQETLTFGFVGKYCASIRTAIKNMIVLTWRNPLS
jgi:hypothetical protein